MRRVMGGTGRAMIASGLLILLFVAHQLWGTGVAEARSQDSLRADFTATLNTPATPTTTSSTSTTSTTTVASAAGPTTSSAPKPVAPPTTRERVPPVPTGDAAAVIEIPRIRLEKAVVEGTTVAALKKGPGHIIGTPLPGQPGNSAISGHRTTYGAPFARLDELRPGDEIVVTTRQGRFTYRMSASQVVKPTDNWVLDPTDDNRLTLTTCHPRYSAAQRLIITAMLEDIPAPGPPPGEIRMAEPEEAPDLPGEQLTERPSDAPGDQTPGDVPGESPQDGEVDGTEEAPSLDVSGQAAPNGPAIIWGVAAAGVWLAAWAASRRLGKPVAYALGVPVFGVALFQFFENFARLLPANV